MPKPLILRFSTGLGRKIEEEVLDFFEYEEYFYKFSLRVFSVFVLECFESGEKSVRRKSLDFYKIQKAWKAC